MTNTDTDESRCITPLHEKLRGFSLDVHIVDLNGCLFAFAKPSSPFLKEKPKEKVLQLPILSLCVAHIYDTLKETMQY